MQCYSIICICISYNNTYKYCIHPYIYIYIYTECIQCTHVLAAQDEQEVTLYAKCVFSALIRGLNTSSHIYMGLHTHLHCLNHRKGELSQPECSDWKRKTLDFEILVPHLLHFESNLETFDNKSGIYCQHLKTHII